MAKCIICNEDISGKASMTSDKECICKRCSSAIALLGFDNDMTLDSYDFTNNDSAYYRELCSEMEFPERDRLMFNFKTKKISIDKGVFKKKFQVFQFSDVKKIEYRSTKKKNLTSQEIDNKSTAAGVAVGVATAVASNAVRGGVTGARVKAMSKAMAGADFIDVYYTINGKEEKYFADGSLHEEQFLKICECFEEVRTVNEEI